MNVRAREWTVLVYSSASPDIEAAGHASLRELASARLPDSVAVGVQYGTDEGVRRYALAGADRTDAPSPAASMADPSSLEDFLRWGMRELPARRYMVVVGGHAGGFLGAVTSADRTRMMPLADLGRTLERFPSDVLVFNACLMGQAEVASEVAGAARFLVAAQGLEHHEGVPLGRVVERLGSGVTARDAAEAVVVETRAMPQRVPALSAVDLSRVAPVRDALDVLGARILEAPSQRGVVRAHVEALPGYVPDRPWDRPLSDYKDLGAFARRLEADARLAGSGISDAARRLRAALDHAVVASYGGEGLSAYLPTRSMEETHGPVGRQVEALYRGLALARSTRWDEAMLSLGERPKRPFSAQTLD